MMTLLQRARVKGLWETYIPAALWLTFSFVFCIAGCRLEASEDNSESAHAQPQQVVIQYKTAAEQPIADRLDLSAKVQADPAKMFRVFPPASGRVLGIKVKPGDKVV